MIKTSCCINNSSSASEMTMTLLFYLMTMPSNDNVEPYSFYVKGSVHCSDYDVYVCVLYKGHHLFAKQDEVTARDIQYILL